MYKIGLAPLSCAAVSRNEALGAEPIANWLPLPALTSFCSDIIAFLLDFHRYRRQNGDWAVEADWECAGVKPLVGAGRTLRF